MKAMSKVLIWFFLLPFMDVIPVGQTVPMAAAGTLRVTEPALLLLAGKGIDLTQKQMPGNEGTPDTMKLSFRDFVRLIREKNEQIGYQEAQWAISQEAVKGAKAIFEPAFVASVNHEEDNRRNTVQEAVSQGFTAEFHQDTNSYRAALEALVPTGGQVSLGYQVRDFSNNIEERYGVDGEHVMFLGATLTQPLLKGGGLRPTMAGIQVARAAEMIAFQSYREQMMRVVFEGMIAYWELYTAREKYQVRTDSVHNAEQILNDNLIRTRTGKMAATEVLEAEAGLALRQSLQTEARQQVVFSMNSVRTFFSSSAAEKNVEIEPVDRIEIEPVRPDFAASLIKATKLRAEYLSTQKKIEREQIRLVFAKNQRWPQLDLKASYGVNGLSVNSSGAWEDIESSEYKTWSVGLEFRIPLGGGGKSRSELQTVRHQKRQALIELKAVEVALANAVDTATRSVRSTLTQLKHYQSVVDFNQRLLDAETARFKAGKSNSRLLLEKEEDLNRARESLLDSLLKYKKAMLGLQLAEGSLLLNNGLEVMEVDL